MSAALDKKKKIVAWSHRCAATPRNYRDRGMTEGKVPLYIGCVEPDDFPAGLVANLEKSFFPVASGMPRGWWRGPIHTFHAFAVQCFIDEIAVATKQDAVQLRLDLLGPPRRLKYEDSDKPGFDTGRLAGVLQLAADADRLEGQAQRRPRRRHRLSFHVRRLRRARVRSVGGEATS
jgi:isoquinoline 1-oxidoreductase beta subunit